MIEFPPVEMPSDLTGVANGKLGPCNLTTVYFPQVGHLSMHPLAARAWHAMTAVCKAETKADLTTTGTYRSIDAQLQLFLQRYTPTFLPIRNVITSQRNYQGKTWWLKRGYSPAAVPGTSNHGWGIAVDIAIAAPLVVPITADPKVWQWVQDNAMSFGFGWEGARPGMPGWEPWHLRYWAGDLVPARVRDVEAWFAAQVKP
jgi:LAS superfamily LD-carboxypeptidase LdcB